MKFRKLKRKTNKRRSDERRIKAKSLNPLISLEKKRGKRYDGKHIKANLSMSEYKEMKKRRNKKERKRSQAKMKQNKLMKIVRRNEK